LYQLVQALVSLDRLSLFLLANELQVVQCVAVCCSVVQCVAVCCSVLHCVAVCCSGVGVARSAVAVSFSERTAGGAACCNVLQCVAVWCSVLQCVAVVLVSLDRLSLYLLANEL